MSEIRLIMLENNKALSGHIPSSAIPSLMWAISQGADNPEKLWQLLDEIDPGLYEHFSCNNDDSPLLEGFDDGLLVINWDHNCIESFQNYQPLKFSGVVIPHNGKYLDTEHDEIPYQIKRNWNIIDHHFEESRH